MDPKTCVRSNSRLPCRLFVRFWKIEIAVEITLQAEPTYIGTDVSRLGSWSQKPSDFALVAREIVHVTRGLLGLLTDYNRPSLAIPNYTRGICRYKCADIPQCFAFSSPLDFSFLSFLACNALPTLLEFSRPTSLDIHIPMLATSFKSPGAV